MTTEVSKVPALEECIRKAKEEAGNMTREDLESYYLDRRTDELFEEWLDTELEGAIKRKESER